MNTLLLRLVGPMQSWGLQSHFGVRDTGREPSKSGVLGLVCAALGIPREDDQTLETLAILRMGVRVDREGRLQRDYHTASNVLKAGGGLKDTELSTRYFLADAAFLVGLEGSEIDLLEKIHQSLANPTWPLYFGRKAFVPGLPVHLEDGLLHEVRLEDALRQYPYIGRGDPPEQLRVILEAPDGEFIRPDQPVSYAKRQFAARRVQNRYIDFSTGPKE